MNVKTAAIVKNAGTEIGAAILQMVITAVISCRTGENI